LVNVNEHAKHFYRKLGYQDKGGIFMDGTPFEQPQEMIIFINGIYIFGG